MTVTVSAEDLATQALATQARQIRDDLLSGKLSLAAVVANPVDIAGNYGVEIPEAHQSHLTTHVQSVPGCVACDIGLTIALAGLATLAVGAVAVAVAVFAPEFAIPAVIAFLSSGTFLAVFTIVEGVIVASAGALATYLCQELIKC